MIIVDLTSRFGPETFVPKKSRLLILLPDQNRTPSGDELAFLEGGPDENTQVLYWVGSANAFGIVIVPDDQTLGLRLDGVTLRLDFADEEKQGSDPKRTTHVVRVSAEGTVIVDNEIEPQSQFEVLKLVVEADRHGSLDGSIPVERATRLNVERPKATVRIEKARRIQGENEATRRVQITIALRDAKGAVISPQEAETLSAITPSDFQFLRYVPPLMETQAERGFAIAGEPRQLAPRWQRIDLHSAVSPLGRADHLFEATLPAAEADPRETFVLSSSQAIRWTLEANGRFGAMHSSGGEASALAFSVFANDFVGMDPCALLRRE
ncbi:MAG: hypothetical protein AAGJ83_15910, partial [Planctomycetota bacterium]